MKIVAGMNECQLKTRVVNKQIELGGDVDVVCVWLEFFNQASCDYNKTSHERCKDCKDKGRPCEGSRSV
ncbi:hypothetical protein D5P06_06110 [Salmonella enterica subsp. enterica serovar Agbeni]|nr:hypothetical protein [Salmonella enterica subsp. enterica serovar Agbeni]EBW3019723.1 hypothetical protein [Salmonella enterica subsp. enterica serovar Agbeni]EBX0811177.1 hypothetical protein [Salmonella enterica subsp. enterica serovar Agbeni]EBX3308045.1 hypothetical protein [Salmonella enterica subsp. enterica serovar Agbeni]EBX7669412.1 hypothetical protein [Salmonella enterica subsp. enterica serovar Agbeni]